MRTAQQVEKAAIIFINGGTKTAAMIAAGYSAKSAQSNTNKVFPPGSYRHERFAQGLFILNWNKTKAAIYAGYNPKWAGTNTVRLMRHPRVKVEILRIRRRLFPKDYPTPEAHGTKTYGF